MVPRSLLIIDDDPQLVIEIKKYLAKKSIEVTFAIDPDKGLALFRQNPERFPVVILDYQFPGETGDSFARRIKRVRPSTVVLMYSGDTSRESMRLSYKAGATDFIDKDSDPEVFLNEVEAAFKRSEEQQLVFAGETPSPQTSFGLIGISPGVQSVIQKIREYKKNKYNVLILGESGTGKERIARALHGGMKGSFLAVNCASYVDSLQLMESELFGYMKGAFTGADKTTAGLFESAENGVLFLDEVHQLSTAAQVKLLRVLQQKAVRKVGGKNEIPINCRIVAAAKPEISQKRDRGEFLIDLYNRLYVFPIEVPALRDRIEDIGPLASHFCEKYSKEVGKSKRFLSATIDFMKTYHWPGNVRELENLVLRLVVNSPDDLISSDDLERELKRTNEPDSEISNKTVGLKISLERFEKEKILEALVNTEFNQVKAAKLLNVPESTLRNKMKRFGFYESTIKQGNVNV